jgi:hypothetical protein
MVIGRRNYSRFGLVWLSIFGLVAVLQTSPAHAYPVLDQEVYYHGGSLQLEILPSDSAYTSQIYLHTGTGSILLGTNTNTGLVISLSNPLAAGLMPGDEFILGIHVINTGNDFVMGGGYDNPDGIAHAAVNYLYNHVTVIGFEDLFGGGDLDYNDARVRVIGDIGLTQIPEPASLILFGSGLVGLMLSRRRKTNAL